MSQENVELVETAIAAWSRGDLEEVLELAAPDIEYRTSGAFPGLRSVYHGREGFGRFMRDFRDPWDEITFSPDRLVDAGEHVVVLGRFEARGRDGIVVGKELGFVFTVREGAVTQITAHAAWDEALEALAERESKDTETRS